MSMSSHLTTILALVFGIGLGMTGVAVADKEAQSVYWQTLIQLDYQTGTYSEELGKLNGSTVQVPGYAVPLEIDGQHMVELALVPQLGMCIHVPPPPPNQMVYVKLKKKVSYQELWARPIWVTGNFQIDSTEGEYGAMGFTLFNATVRPYVPPKQQ